MASGLSALALAATCGPALAFGHHGHRHHGGDMQFFLLAHAAGITGEQIHTAFKAAAPTLKADFENLKSTKKLADACIIAGTAAGCSTPIGNYSSAQSKLTLDKLGVWQTLFATNGATKDAAAVTLKGNLENLDAQKRQLLHSVFSSAKNSDSATPESSQQ